VTHDEAMKLLGGYATNTLSEEERKALLNAAIDDQELFDALEREQALKDVFDDRMARAEIRQALEPPPSAWWNRPWAWGGAGIAVAAMALAAVWLGDRQHEKAPVEVAQVTQTEKSPPVPAVSSPQPSELKPPAPARATRARESAKKQEEPRAAALAKDALKEDQAAPVQQALPSGVAGAASQLQLQATSQDMTRSMLAASKSASPPPISYSLLRRDASQLDIRVSPSDVHEADSVRLTVQPLSAGMLSVFLLRNGVSLPLQTPLKVAARQSYVVPDVPLVVKPGDALQLVFTSSGFSSSVVVPLGKP